MPKTRAPSRLLHALLSNILDAARQYRARPSSTPTIPRPLAPKANRDGAVVTFAPYLGIVQNVCRALETPSVVQRRQAWREALELLHETLLPAASPEAAMLGEAPYWSTMLLSDRHAVDVWTGPDGDRRVVLLESLVLHFEPRPEPKLPPLHHKPDPKPLPGAVPTRNLSPAEAAVLALVRVRAAVEAYRATGKPGRVRRLSKYGNPQSPDYATSPFGPDTSLLDLLALVAYRSAQAEPVMDVTREMAGQCALPPVPAQAPDEPRWAGEAGAARLEALDTICAALWDKIPRQAALARTLAAEDDRGLPPCVPRV